MSAPTRKTLDLPNGMRLSYLEWSAGGTTPLLLLHGMADHAMVWLSLGKALQQTHHIIAPDLRGHGESSKPKTGYGFEQMIGDLEALMAALNWESAHVLGHSWSAKLVTRWVHQAPERFRSLMLIDPAFMGTLPRWTKIIFPIYYKVLPFLKMLGPFENKAAAEAQARELKQYKGWSALQQRVFEASVEEKANGQWGSKFTIDAREPMFMDVMRVSGLTQPIDIPSLLVTMTQGINTSERQLKPYKTYLTRLELCQLESNHWAFLVDPEAFEQAITQFLTQQEPHSA
ncbi:MAG: alpha/beta hydrolase [Cyanobacteria bacterium P01_F01_bin.53]